MSNSRRIPSAKQIFKSFFFRRLLVRAGGIVGKPFLLYDVAKKSLEKAEKDSSFRGVASEALASVLRLGRLVRAYAKGDYRDVSRKNIVLVVAGLLYFVSPLDLIPDAIPILGFADDIAVLGFILKTLGEELTRYEAFEEARKSDLAQHSYNDLLDRATARNIEGRERMSRDELAQALAEDV